MKSYILSLKQSKLRLDEAMLENKYLIYTQ